MDEHKTATDNWGILDLFISVDTETAYVVAKSWPERRSSGELFQVFVSVSFLIKWRRYGITVNTTGNACKMETGF